MDNGFLAGVALAIASILFIFWPEKTPFIQPDKTRVDSLLERKDAIYANLRDLSFEFQAGKYPEQDYVEQRSILEREAATTLSELETLKAQGIQRTRT